jgi:putative PIN family toxin of toxin-antitoxin system
MVSDTIPLVRPRIVLDTNVLVTALRSHRGASFRLLNLMGKGRFDVMISVPLVFEYEEVLMRLVDEGLWTKLDMGELIDYFCRISLPQPIFFLWRPTLLDPKDDFVLEAAVAGSCDAIVTYNKKDFREAEKFGIQILTPKEFLTTIGDLS